MKLRCKARRLRLESLENRHLLSVLGDLDLGYAIHADGQGFDEAHAVAADEDGSAYVTGFFQGTADFDPGTETYNLTSSGKEDVFVAKYAVDGELLWARAMGGGKKDFAYGIALADGGVCITGSFQGTADFDPGSGTYDLNSAGNADIFVAKLDSNGDFLWARSMGGIGYDVGHDITIDSDGNVYTTGSFQKEVDFDPGAETSSLISAGAADIFISKLDADGNFLWAQRAGEQQNDHGYGIAVGTDGSVYTTGDFRSTVDFDPGAGSYELTSAGQGDVFAWKLDADGNFLGARRVGGKWNDVGRDIAVGSEGSVFITGDFQKTADFDPGEGTYELTSAGQSDAFVAKLDPSGNFAWARGFGGKFEDRGFGVALGEDGSIFTTGSFWGTSDFDPGPGTFALASAGKSDVFISQLDSAGNLLWAGRMGGTKADAGYGIAVAGDGSLCVVGFFELTADFDPSEATLNLTSAGKTDIFVTRFQYTQPPFVLATPLPWANIDTISVVFSENADVEAGDLALGGVNVGDYIASDGLSSFSYDSNTLTATWILAAPIDIDNLLIQLNGLPTVDYVLVSGSAWAPAFLDEMDAEGLGHPTIPHLGFRIFGEAWNAPSGYPLAGASLNEAIASPSDPTTADDFLLQFGILPGDADQSGRTDVLDYGELVARWREGPGGDYSVFADTDGSGRIDVLDYGEMVARWREGLPDSEEAAVDEVLSAYWA